MEYNKLLEKANGELKRVLDFIEKNAGAFGSMDLKLHQVSFYDYRKDFPLCAGKEDLFYDFCELEYEAFIEWCKNEGIDFDEMRNNIGRTSKFYLHNFNDSNMDYVLYNIIAEYGCWWYGDYFAIVNGIIVNTDITDYKEETTEALEYLANELYNDFVNGCDDILIVYSYIKDFKDNQVDNFKLYLEGVEDFLLAELKAEEEAKEKSKKICKNIKDKYCISNTDMQLLKENILNF